MQMSARFGKRLMMNKTPPKLTRSASYPVDTTALGATYGFLSVIGIGLYVVSGLCCLYGVVLLVKSPSGPDVHVNWIAIGISFGLGIAFATIGFTMQFISQWIKLSVWTAENVAGLRHDIDWLAQQLPHK
jgi:hypothetical protein